MSNNAGSSNVIPMRDFDRPTPNPQEAQFERLLKECQSLALDRLMRSVSGMLDKVEDALWGLANNTHDRERRDLYITAKDKALAQRKYIEDQYRANVLAEFDARMRHDRKQRDDFSHFELGSLELGLVNNDDLEETLKINEMAAKLRRYCEDELNALDQRIGVLIGDANLHGEGNPFSPQVVCNSFKQTSRQIESNLKIRMIFHKLFDDHVLDDVRSIYKDLNDLLVQRSILPKIRYGMRRPAGGIGPRPGIPGAAIPGMPPPGSPADMAVPGVGMAVPGAAMPGVGIPGVGMPGAGMPVAGMPGGSALDGGYAADGSGGGEQDFFAVLQGLIAMNAQAAYGGGGLGGGAVVPGAVPGGGGVAGAGGMVHIPGFPPIMGVPGASGGIAGVGGAAGGVAGVGVPRGGGVLGGVGGVAGAGVAGGLAGAGGIPGGVAGAPVGVFPRLLQGAELIGSLTRLQHGDFGAIPNAPASLDAEALNSGRTNVVRELKSTELGKSVDQTDGMTIDIVAMLFDQIFGDPRVPHALKALIGRLQIPVVKVAVLDKKFFSKKSHPARRMLDTIGEFAVGLDEKFDETSPVYKKLEEIIQKVIEDFVDDIDIFETLQTDLLALIREENTRAEQAAKEAARKIAYVERLEVGKAIAEFEIKKRAEATRMPQLVLKLLADECVKFLLLAHARHGKDSDAWKSALETMDLLIWSANQKPSVEDRRKLATMLPGLLKRLQAGLLAAGTEPEIRRVFFSKLMRLHTKVISGAAPAAAVPRAAVVPTLTEAVSPASSPERPDARATGTAESVRHEELSDLQVAPLPTIDFPGSRDTEHGSSDPVPSEHGVAARPIAAMPAREPEIDEDAAPATEAPEFSSLTIPNPFGDGDIEVEEISISDLPGVPELQAAGGGGGAKPTDQHSQSVTSLRNGDWLEFRDDDDNRTQAKLSYISPLKGTYLFVNRQGVKVGEYSLYELAREFRTGRAVVLEAVPLFDRAMSSLVGALKKK
ncbi:MAG TPA: DUF1631 domain-containing protein [Burkholderiales bacterium]|nr:DUF1631 domain-containing protein [Burkholderiales bacterium]